LTPIPCSTTIGNACPTSTSSGGTSTSNASTYTSQMGGPFHEAREPQPLPHARVSPSAADLLRAHVHRVNGRWVPNGT
jgi:hypothetical protein